MKRLILAGALIVLAFSSDAWATGNLKPGVANTIAKVRLADAECVWDTTFSVTISSLDSIQVHCWSNRIRVESLTLNMGYAVQLWGSQEIVPAFSTTLGSGWKRVDTELVSYPALGVTLYNANTFSSMDRILKGIIFDGAASGTIRVSAWSER